MVDLPNFLGPVDAFLFNSVFGNLHSPRDALLRSSLMLRPGGSIVVSHPMGRAWHSRYRDQQPDLVPHRLPGTANEFKQVVNDLPLEVLDVVDEPDFYLAHVQASAMDL